MEEIKKDVPRANDPNQLVNETIPQNDLWKEHFQKENIFEKIILKKPTMKQKKKQVGNNLFLSYCSTFFFLGLSVWFAVVGKQSLNSLKAYIYAINATSAGGICIGVIYKVTPNLKEVFRVFFLMDSIFLATILAGFAFFYELLFITQVTWEVFIILPFYCLQIFTTVTSVKLTLLYMKWSKWKLILMKSLIIYLGISFFSFGIYYVITRNTYIQIKDPKVKNDFNKAGVLFVFAQFSYFYQILKKFNDFDGTNLLKYDYYIKNINQQKLKARKNFILQKRNTVNTINYLKQYLFQHNFEFKFDKRPQNTSLTQNLKRIKFNRDYQILQKIQNSSINLIQNDIFSKRILFKNKTVIQNKIVQE